MDNLRDIKQHVRLLPMADREALLAWLVGCIDPQAPGDFIAETRPTYADRSARILTVEQYLDLEDKAELRHEYINGSVYAMSGATVVHNRITFQLATALSSRLHGSPCKGVPQ